MVWLLDDRSPTGAAAMALRRATVLAPRADVTVLALGPGGRPGAAPPPGSPLRRVARASGAAGEIAMARADVVLTTSELTLASAAARRTGRGRLVHLVHEPLGTALGRARIARALPAVDWLLVPEHSDLDRLAPLAPLPRDRVVPVADFVLPTDCLLASARAHVVLAAGRLDDDSVLDVVDGFAAAALPDWQLRIAGGGSALPGLADHVEAHGLAERVRVLGECHDLARRYLDAGIVVRLAAPEAAGLSVLEALGSGVPVISSAASPTAAAHVRTGVNGTLLERTDATSIAAAVIELADDERRAAYADSARAEPAGLLDERRHRQVQDLLDSVLDSAVLDGRTRASVLTAQPGSST